jgi:hypothetical protein
MSSDEEEEGNLMNDLELVVSEALGISLLEVHAWYFQGSDEDDDRELDGECECEC